MHWVGRRLFAGIVWGMVPFLIASGMPRVGCVCANGDHRPFCQGFQHDGQSPEKSCSACNGCEGCAATPAKNSISDQSDRSCCGQPVRSASSGVTHPGRCCQPYLILPSAVKNDVAVSPPLVDDELVSQSITVLFFAASVGMDFCSQLSPPPISSGVDILERGCVLVI